MSADIEQPPARPLLRRRRRRWSRTTPVRYALLLLVLLISVGPLLWQFLSSLKGFGEALFGRDATLFPQSPTLDAYVTIFRQIPMDAYLTNSAIVCALTIASQVVLPTAAGYMLSRRGWRGRRVTFTVLIVSMVVPFESIMVSLFLMTQELGLLDTLVGAWLPGAVSAMNVLIMRAAFTAVPDEIEDAAFLDGASEWQRFTALFLPSSIGAMLVVVVNSFITAWDDFLWPLLVLRSESSFTVSLGLARLSASSFGFDPRVVMAGSIIAVVPVLVVFIVLQRWFHRGVAAGGVK